MSQGKKDSPLIKAVSCRDLKKVRLLLKESVDVDEADKDGSTALMIACSIGKKKGADLIAELLEAGADVNIAREDEMTALKFAVDESDLRTIEKLLDHGAEIDGPKKTDQTAFILAARANRPEVLELLYERGADINYVSKLSWAEGRNALGVAEMEKRYKAVKYLKTILS